MIFLFTDFGAAGPYLGQVQAALTLAAPGIPVIDLVNNAPSTDPAASSYLLAALARQLPAGCVVLGVVDPGVGGPREPVAVQADGRWFVGPDNGLFAGVASDASRLEWRVIDWRPARLSASFHGRDLFAPIAAWIARGEFSWAGRRRDAPDFRGWGADCDRIVYCDVYGNAFTGRRYDDRLAGKHLAVNGVRLASAGTFCDVPRLAPFWYPNSLGLVEIAVNCGSAQAALGLEIGMPVRWAD